MKKPNVAVVGASGLVGRTFLKVLEERDFPIENLYVMSSYRSAGKTVSFKGKDYVLEELTEHSFDKPIDIALFSAGGSTSEKFAPIAAAHGCTVVDNSSAWRMDPEVPLVVPEVNPQDIELEQGHHRQPQLLHHPGYGSRSSRFTTDIRSRESSIPPIRRFPVPGVKRISETWKNGLKGNDTMEAYPHPIAGNCLPHIDVFLDNGYTKEEMKMINETHKILGDD